MIIATISTQRSGTKLLGNCFQMGTVVTPFGEVFNPDVAQVGSFAEFMSARGSKMAAMGNTAVLDSFFGQFLQVCPIAAIDVMFNQIEIPCISWNDKQAPFALYGYLREVEAVVVSLLRDPLDSFVSMKYLTLAGGSAHHGSGSGMASCDALGKLDEKEFLDYRDYIEWHRNALDRSMSENKLYYRLHYSDLAREGVPHSLRELIRTEASRRGMNIENERIQLFPAAMRPSGVPYARVFDNLDDLQRNYGPADVSMTA